MSVRTELREHALWITLDRPDALNALDWATLEELAVAWDRVDDDDEVWLAVLTGAGDTFCVGADLLSLPAESAARAERGESAVPPMPFRDRRARKPMLAAINGDALGGGLELALACDLRIVASHARLGLPEARWSAVPAAGGTQRLPRTIPLGLALEMMLVGDPIDAEQARAAGLVNRVVQAADLLDTTSAVVARILENAPLATRAIKQAVYDGLEQGAAVGLQLEQRALFELQGTADYRDGITAFAERRRPVWQGR
jgi:enoyl-CoA hydratase/carnithine racemase